MRYTAFQRAVSETEPRGLVLFTSAFSDVLPHIVAQADGLTLEVEMLNDLLAAVAGPESGGGPVDSPSDGNGAGTEEESRKTNSPKHAAENTTSASAGSFGPSRSTTMASQQGIDSCDAVRQASAERIVDAVRDAMDRGVWLVLPDVSAIPHDTWREIGRLLVFAIPEEEYPLRRHFRFFTFYAEGTPVQGLLPPLICQYAFAVDSQGDVCTRAHLGPLFEGLSTLSSASRTKLGAMKGRDNAQTEQYLQLLIAAMRTRTPQETDVKEPATSPAFIHEVLFSAREAMIQEQAQLIDQARLQDAILFRKEEQRQAEKKQTTLSIHDEEETEEDKAIDVEKNMKALEQNHEWLYENMLQFLVNQCPAAQVKVLPQLPESEVEKDELIWTHGSESCYAGQWCGCRVLIKEPQMSLRQDWNEKDKRMAQAEASRHFLLRHPNVLSLYGVCDNSLVQEDALGTLEQTMIRARFDSKRWTVAQFLSMGCHILRGMVYLSTRLIHRDISCRCVYETPNGEYKIGHFATAIPINHVSSEVHRGIIPIAWTAPEGFAGLYEPKSDMWSFGILLWMAVHYCTEQPYRQFEFAPDAIMEGEIMPCPAECPQFLYDHVMLRCWDKEASRRPSALSLLTSLNSALRRLPQQLLDAVIPFPTDEQSFDQFNGNPLDGKNLDSFIGSAFSTTTGAAASATTQ